MSAPIDKPFAIATPCQAGAEPFAPAPTPPGPPYTPPPPDAVDPAEDFPNPVGPTQLPPDQIIADSMLVNIFLNNQAQVFKAMGEEILVYRQKQYGQTCACVEPDSNQPQDGCRICFGTRFVGGYDMIGKTAGYIGANPLARKLTELGITLSQKPVLSLLPNIVIRDRDFVLAKARTPVVDLQRFQQEPVVRGALSADIDPLFMLNARKVIKISLTKGGTVLPVPAPDTDPVGNFDAGTKNGGGYDFVDGVDFILTGGELSVDNALTTPPNADTRILRVLGKRAPLSPPDSETATGEVDPIVTLFPDAGLSAGLAAKAFNRAAQPQAFSTTLTVGAGADAGFYLITLVGTTGSNLSNSVTYPAADFLVTIVGSAILWLGANRPPLNSTYYVSYEAAINVTRRYQVQNVTVHHFQGVALAQEGEVELMDQTHPIYAINSIYDQGPPLDRQSGDLDKFRKDFGAASGLVVEQPNVSDPRFVNPGDFLP